MKTTKRFIAMAAALTLTACMAMPMASFATDVYVDKSTGDTTNGYMADTELHTYTAYPVFTGTYTNGGLQVTAWASGYDSTSLLGAAAFRSITTSDSSTIGAKLDAITTGGGTVTAPKVAQILDLVTDSAQKDALAKVLYANKGTVTGTALSQNSESKTSLDQGYYVVDDTYTQSGDKIDAKSKFILRVAGSDAITIIPKKSYPSVVKKVQENSDVYDYNGMGESGNTNYNDVADYCIGNAVPFKLYGSMPATLADYSAYYYKFTDTLGSQFDQPTTIRISVGNATLTATWNTETSKYVISGDTGTNCRVTWSGGTLTISFENIKAYAGVDKDTIVTVTYSAVLNGTANMGRPGQENAVKLTYSNNPNFVYSPNTSDEKEDTPKDNKGTPDDTSDDEDNTDETPEDKVIVFTYELDITKEDKDTGAKLSGAKFKLANAATNGEYAILNPKNVDGKTNVYTFGGWDTSGTGTEIETDSNGIFYILGLDEGTYWLDETKAPDEYSGLSARKKMTLTATTLEEGTTNQSWSGDATDALTALSLQVDEGTATASPDNTNYKYVEATIVNTKSNALPTTGGIGTTLFILGGGCEAGLAGIYLVSKK